MSEFNTEVIPGSFNAQVVSEFRANHGRVGGQFEGAPMILVHHTGVRSGTERVTPLLYHEVQGGWAVFAAQAGAPTDPQWYRNLVAQPDTTIEVGDETVEVVARVAEGEERDRIRNEWQRLVPVIAEYEAKAAPRRIPVVIFEPNSTTAELSASPEPVSS
jgi:deazaflavin-dependent oxidoreductase (nitroreductase family)